MQTTVDLPEHLYRQAEAEAVRQGRSLPELLTEGLRLVLGVPENKTVRVTHLCFPLIKSKDPSRRLTPEVVAALEEELLTEEAVVHGRSSGH